MIHKKKNKERKKGDKEKKKMHNFLKKIIAEKNYPKLQFRKKNCILLIYILIFKFKKINLLVFCILFSKYV
jgi:hypothetical protein